MDTKQHAPAEHGSAKNLTRRAFAASAAGVIGSMFLEPLAGRGDTFLMPWASEEALAEEDSSKPSAVASVTVDAGKFCVVVYDTAKSDNPCIVDASVSVTSLYNNQKAQGTTDSKGCAFIDLEPLAEKRHSDIAGDLLEFEASISVTVDGHRQVSVPRVHISDRQAVGLPTRALDSNPYFRTLALDGWDIQYNQQEFILSPANDATHELTAELYFPDAARYSVQPVISKSATDSRVGQALSEAQTVEGGKGEFKSLVFKGAYFNTADSNALQVGDSIKLVVSDPAKSGEAAKLSEISCGLSAYLAPCKDAEAGGSDSIAPASPASSGSAERSATGLYKPGDTKVNLPSQMPGFLSGLSFTCWTPDFPIYYKFEPAGSLVMCLDIELLNWSNKADVYTGDRTWRSQPRGTTREQLDEKIQLFKNQVKKYQDLKAKSIANGGKIATKAATDVTLNLTFQFLSQMSYDKAKRLWSGDLDAIIGVDFSVCRTWQYVVWFIPFYIDIELDISLAAALVFDVTSDAGAGSAGDLGENQLASLYDVFSNLKFNPRGDETSLLIAFGVAATLALGVKGLIGAGIRGSGGLSFSFQWRDGSNPAFAGKQNPRILIGAHAEITVFAQLLFFKKSALICQCKKSDLYDSDKDNDVQAASLEGLLSDSIGGGAIEAEFSNYQKGGELWLEENEEAGSIQVASEEGGIDLDEFVIVKESELLGVAEIVASGTPQAVALADDDLDADRLATTAFSTGDIYVDGDDIRTSTMQTTAAAMEASLASLDDEAGYSYTWNDGHGSSYKDYGQGDDAIAGISKRGAVKPRHVNTLATDVFSAPRSKLIEIGDTRYLFRVAPVSYDGNTLGRIVYQRITSTEASAPYPIEFDTKAGTGIAHETLHDYNFDARIIDKNSGAPEVVLLVISGQRANGDQTTIHEAAEATIASCVRLVPVTDAGDKQPSFTVGSADSWASKTYEETKKYFAYREPRLLINDDLSVAAFDELDRDGRMHVVGFYLIEQADTKEELLVTGKGDTAVGVVHFAFALEDGKKDVIQTSRVPVDRGTISVVPDCLQKGSDPSSLYISFGYATGDGCGVQALKLDYALTDGCNKISKITRVPVIATDAKVKTLSPWDSTDTLIAGVSGSAAQETRNISGYIAQATLPGVSEIEAHVGQTSAFAEFDLTCISPDDVPIGDLHLRAGHKYCYYSLNHTGAKGYEYDTDGNATVHKEDPAYQIKALAQVDGIFTDPFIFAECDQPIDAFFAIEDTTKTSASTTSFVTTYITEFNSSKSNVIAFDVPFLRCISVDAVATLGAYAKAGASNKFTITVTNDGNTVITQAKLVFTDEETGRTIGDMTLNFDEAENAANSGLDVDSYDMDKMSKEGKANILVADNGDAALVPGQSRSFVVEIQIPETWSGTKKLKVYAPAVSITYVDPNDGKVTDSSENVELYDTDEINSFTAEVNVLVNEDSSIDDSDLDGDMDWADDDADDDGNGGGPGGGNGGGSGNGGPSGSGGRSGKKIPATGDSPLGGLAYLTAAAGAAGLGLAAYGKRRASIAQDEAENRSDAE